MDLYERFSENLPKSEKVVVVLSGGMDSSIVARLCVRRYGIGNVHAITYFYNQKQQEEIACAKKVAKRVGISSHKILDIGCLNEISKPFSATEILGNPTPSTYIPNRNAILLMIAAAYAESNEISAVITGLQAQSQYGDHDTTPSFIAGLNAVLDQARTRKVKIVAPFNQANKAEEILLLQEIDGNVDLLSDTLTCYNPTDGVSCGRCQSCSERIANFIAVGMQDPLQYSINIDWSGYR